MKRDVDTEKSPKDTVKDLVSSYIPEKPKKISLRLFWDDKRSVIRFKSDGLDQTAEYSRVVDFTSFAHGVLEAYREAYGELKPVPISFREEYTGTRRLA